MLECLKSLWYKGMGARRNRIDAAASGTCNWLSYQLLPSQDDLKDESDSDPEVDRYGFVISRREVRRNADDLVPEMFWIWMRAGGLLWIEGKAGSGKSTLMNQTIEIVENSQHSSAHVAIIHFFFNARGSAAEQSPTSLFRTLLYQLLVQFRENLGMSSMIVTEHRRQKNTQNEVTWDLKELKLLFEQICQSAGPAHIIVFLDALDEMQTQEGHTASDVIRFFSAIRDKAQNEVSCKLSVCFSSRPMSSIDLWWSPSSPKIIMQEHNNRDISLYVQQILGSLKPGDCKGVNLDHIAKRIIEKANGVFLWVTLVMRQILSEVQIATQDELDNLLDETPDQLGDLYHQIVLQIDGRRKPEAMQMITAVMFAGEPLSVSELHFIFFVSHDMPFASYIEMKKATGIVQDEMRLRRRIGAYTCGLLEIVNDGPRQVVQALHQSVIDFFWTEAGITLLQPSSLSIDSLVQNVHCFFSRACVNALCLAAGCEEHPIWGAPFRGPFVGYALDYWVWHIQGASMEVQRGAMDRMMAKSGEGFTFLRNQLDLPKRILDRDQLPLGENASPLYLLVYVDLLSCAEYLIDAQHTSANIVGGHLETPLALAIRANQENMITSLLDRGATLAYNGGRYQNVLQAIAANGDYDSFLRAIGISQGARQKLAGVENVEIGKILHCAMSSREGLNIIHYILNNAPNSILVRVDGELPIERAIRWKNTNLFWLVLDKMVEIGVGKNIKPTTVLNLWMKRDPQAGKPYCVTEDFEAAADAISLDQSPRDIVLDFVDRLDRKTPPFRGMINVNYDPDRRFIYTLLSWYWHEKGEDRLLKKEVSF